MERSPLLKSTPKSSQDDQRRNEARSYYTIAMELSRCAEGNLPPPPEFVRAVELDCPEEIPGPALKSKDFDLLRRIADDIQKPRDARRRNRLDLETAEAELDEVDCEPGAAEYICGALVCFLMLILLGLVICWLGGLFHR